MHSRPEWLKAPQVKDVYSVSDCISKDFADYIHFWKHNGYWLFDSPEVIQKLAAEHSIDLAGTKLFYYEVKDSQYLEREDRWEAFAPEVSFTTNVQEPSAKRLEGYDVVSFSVGTNPECSPLSCNNLAAEIETNEHCLLPSIEAAADLLQRAKFTGSEPGPFRVFAIYSVEWPAKRDSKLVRADGEKYPAPS